MKKVRSQDARRALRGLWQGLDCYSCADGTLKIEPRWKKGIRPGLFTRMHSAQLVEYVLGLKHMRGPKITAEIKAAGRPKRWLGD